MVRNLLITAFFSLFCALPVLAEVVTEGSVHLGEANWKVADAIAYTDDNGVRIVFSDKMFDRETLIADGELSPFEFIRHDGNRLELAVESDGPGMCLLYSTRTDDSQFSGMTCKNAYKLATTLTRKQIIASSAACVGVMPRASMCTCVSMCRSCRVPANRQLPHWIPNLTGKIPLESPCRQTAVNPEKSYWPTTRRY